MDTSKDILFDTDDVSIIHDIIHNIIEKYKGDLEVDNLKEKELLADKKQKILDACQKERQKLIDLEDEIKEIKNKIKKLNIQYLVKKNLINKTKQNKESNNEESKSLINIYETKILEYKKEQKHLEDQINESKLKLHNKKNVETEFLHQELIIYDLELERIKKQKLNIKNIFQQEIKQSVENIEFIDNKIQQKENSITNFNNEIKIIERNNNISRRQLIKNNINFIHKNKNLKKVKLKLHKNIEQINFEIYNIDMTQQYEMQQLNETSKLIEQDFRDKINSINNKLEEKKTNLDKMELSAINPYSKTYLTKYNDINNEIDSSNVKLTDAIQQFNQYLSDKSIKIKDIKNKYNADIDYKQNQIKQFHIKLQRISDSENNRITKMNHQHNLNHQKVKQKRMELHEVYVSLQQLNRNRYEYQKIANQYEHDSNIKIQQLSDDLNRAKERIKKVSQRINEKISELNDYNNNNEYTLRNKYNYIEKEIKRFHQMIKDINYNMKHDDKLIMKHNNEIKEIRHNIKDFERQIKAKESKLNSLTTRVELRIKGIKERENEVIENEIKSGLTYLNKKNLLDNIDKESIEVQIEKLSKIFGLDIDF
jgi:hypothetical protein